VSPSVQVRMVKCVACKKHEQFTVYVTRDMSEWEAHPSGWLLFVRNGVILPACSEECAEAHVESYGNSPTSGVSSPAGVMRSCR